MHLLSLIFVTQQIFTAHSVSRVTSRDNIETHHRPSKQWFTQLLLIALISLPLPGNASGPLNTKEPPQALPTVTFNIPRQAADDALPVFGQQANVTVIYPFNKVKDHQTNALQGAYSVPHAVAVLLADTGLEGDFSAEGHLVITQVDLSKGKRMNITTKKSLLATMVGLFAATGAVQQAYGQNGEAATAQGRIDEIIVTASKRETSLQDTALSVSAISGADLNKLGVTSFDQIMATVPGATLLDLGPGASALVFRGISTTPFGGGANPATSTYIDEFPLALQDQDIKLVDIAQIEVLKGPQGTLYGQSALGGVTRYITNKPDFERMEGGFSLTAENVASGDDGYQAQGYFNMPINDNLAMRVVFYEYDNAGFIDNLGTGSEDVNSEEVTGGRLALRWAISDRSEFNLLYLNQSQEVGLFQANGIQTASSTYTPVTDNSIPSDIGSIDLENPSFRSNINPSTERSFEVLNLKLDVNFDTFDLSVMTATKERKYEREWDASLWFGIYDAVTTSFASPWSNNFDTDTVEVRLVSTGDGSIDWIAGVWYEKEEGSIANTIEVKTPRTDLTAFGFPVGNGDVFFNRRSFDNAKELSFYGEVGYRFTDKTKLTLGYRRADIELDSGVLIADGLFDGGQAVAIGVPEDTQEDVNTYKINFEYRVNDDMLAYAVASSGYRAGGFNRSGFSSVSESSPYGSDSLWNYEVGLRSSWFESRLTTNVVAYYIDWSDIQLRTFDTTSLSQRILNAGEAESIGIEAEIRYHATDNLLLSFNYGYTDATLIEDLPGAGATLAAEKGDTLPGSSKNIVSLLMDWKIPLTESIDLQANASYVYLSSRPASLLSTDITSGFPNIPSSDVVNVSAGVRHNNGVTVSLFAENLLDDRNIQTQANHGTALKSAVMNRPRTIGLRAGYSF